MQQTIVTLTMNPALDTSTAVDHVVPERKLRCGPPRHDPGGGGVNVARAIVHLGGVATAVYPAGGPVGQLLGELLDREGVPRRPVPIAAATRENVVVLETATGLQYRFCLPGPTLSAADWRRCLDELAAFTPKPDWLVASGSLPPGAPDDCYVRVADLGRALGARVVVDASGAALRAVARAGVYLLKPNLRELGELAGHELTDETEIEAAARALVEGGHSEVVVVSLGAAGVLLTWRAGSERVRAPTVPIRSKVGAGDSTVAGLVLGLARGWPLRAAARFGVAAGSAAVMNPGTALCRREDAERLYRRMSSPAAAPGATAPPPADPVEGSGARGSSARR